MGIDFSIIYWRYYYSIYYDFEFILFLDFRSLFFNFSSSLSNFVMWCRFFIIIISFHFTHQEWQLIVLVNNNNNDQDPKEVSYRFRTPGI